MNVGELRKLIAFADDDMEVFAVDSVRASVASRVDWANLIPAQPGRPPSLIFTVGDRCVDLETLAPGETLSPP